VNQLGQVLSSFIMFAQISPTSCTHLTECAAPVPGSSLVQQVSNIRTNAGHHGIRAFSEGKGGNSATRISEVRNLYTSG